MSSNSTRAKDRAYAELAAQRDAVAEHGREATVEAVAADSFYVAPIDAPALTSLADGVAPALQEHLEDQGLAGLAAAVPRLQKLGRGRGRDAVERSVSDTVYQMH